MMETSENKTSKEVFCGENGMKRISPTKKYEIPKLTS